MPDAEPAIIVVCDDMNAVPPEAPLSPRASTEDILTGPAEADMKTEPAKLPVPEPLARISVVRVMPEAPPADKVTPPAVAPAEDTLIEAPLVSDIFPLVLLSPILPPWA